MSRCPVLIEREDELRALSAVAGEVTGGGARAVVVTGEPGTGKSRLAQHFASSLPDGWTTRTARITRSGAALPPTPDARPLLFVLDDAHFLDPTALERLPGLLDELGGSPVLVLLTFRLGLHRAGSAEMRALSAIVRDPRAHELRLVPLSPAGVDAMAAAMGRLATGDLYARSGGNPFWVEEVLGGGDRLPWTVVESVGAQLDGLPLAGRDLACALALAEEPVQASAAARLVADLDGAWTALRDAGLGRDDGDGLRLRHALVGEAIQAGLGPAVRADWHRRLAAALEVEPVARDRVARHWHAGGEVQRAAALARPAASELRQRGATRRAFDCFRLAVGAAPEDPLAAAALHEEAALTAARICEYDAMRVWLATAEERYRLAGQPDRAVRMLLDPTFDYLPVRRSRAILDEPVERLLVDAHEALGRLDTEAARALLDAAVEAARSRSDGMALARAARLVQSGLGEFERAEALLDEAAVQPDIAVHPGRESRVLTIRACARYARGYPLEALELLRRGAAISRREPEAVLWTGQLALADVLLLVGHVEEGAEMLVEAGRARWTGLMVAFADGYRRFERGELDAGLDALAAASGRLLTELDFDPVGRGVVASRLLNAQAMCEVNGGRPEAAVRTVRWLDTLAPEPFNDCSADLAYVLARAAAAMGTGDELAEARRRIDEITRVASGPNVLAAAEAVRGYAALGRPAADAGRHFQAAAALYERAPRAIQAAELWCEMALASGAGPAATAALQRAGRLAAAHGIARISARAAAVQERLATRLDAALGTLTSREREVVLLAAEGLSNREIGGRLHLAEGTVRNYLSTAFDKLGVARRAELARLLAATRPAG
ncbi:MAG TPA: LuxR C-terminal-related transcriptional regulator [Candidatus Dormibacteraeota bacterium]|nr:LuxR C-terminal-related transcriptional regulator [Candidatus Dormibacteraeota bacterium]